MLAIIAAILFVLAWFEHGAKVTGVPAWFDWQGLALLGLVCVAADLFWPVWRGRRVPPAA